MTKKKKERTAVFFFIIYYLFISNSTNNIFIQTFVYTNILMNYYSNKKVNVKWYNSKIV